MDTIIDPVDTGTTINFISKTPSYTRVFAMITRGENENPQVADIGRVVNEWIPSSVDTLISSAQNQFIAFSGQIQDTYISLDSIQKVKMLNYKHGLTGKDRAMYRL